MKKCSICKIEKEITEFNKNKSRKDGLNTLCKECSRIKSRDYYKKHPTLHKKNVIKRNKINREILQTYIINIFKLYGCKDCGNKDIRVLEFDHLPQYIKYKEINRIVNNSNSLTLLKKEIDKCDVVCANCHKIRTYSRTKSYRNKHSRSSYG